MSWQERGVCGGLPPELWDPLDSEETRLRGSKPLDHPRIREALRYCAVCPVRAQCLAWAVAGREQGVWGGRYLERDGRARRAA
jgi:Transcription factor WhiB